MNLSLSVYRVVSSADLPGSMVVATDMMDAMARYRQAMARKTAPSPSLSYDPMSGAFQGVVLNPLQVQPTTAVPPAWQPTTSYTQDSVVYDGTNVQTCVTPGTSGSSPPAWNKAVGGQTSDGSVMWQNQGPPGAPPPVNAYKVTSAVNPTGGIILAPLADHACCVFALTQPDGNKSTPETIELLGPVVNTVLIQYRYQAPRT